MARPKKNTFQTEEERKAYRRQIVAKCRENKKLNETKTPETKTPPSETETETETETHPSETETKTPPSETETETNLDEYARFPPIVFQVIIQHFDTWRRRINRCNQELLYRF